MFFLVERGEVYDPEPLGRRSILIVDEKIQKVGSVDRAALERVGVEVEVVDADGCLVLPLVTTNPANVLKLEGKGRIAAGCDADLLIVAPDTLELRDVITRGQFALRNGSVVHREKFLGKSKRAVEILGDQAPAGAVASMLAR